MAEKKRQHYVPQLYLRKFSNNGKTIAIFSLNKNRVVTKNGPISSQCYEDYMYSKNIEIEDALGLMESKAKEVIDILMELRMVPKKTSPDYATLLVFTLYQSVRTQFASDKYNDMVDKIGKIMLEVAIDNGDIQKADMPDLDKISIMSKEPALEYLQAATDIIPAVFDLECKVLINQTSREFITSDNPVVLYNKYYLKDQESYIGFGSKGLLIIMPISPKYSLLYYDSKMYKIGGKKLHIPVVISKSSDVDELNALQLINANETAYMRNVDEKYLKILNMRTKEYRPHEKTTVRKSIKISNEKEGQLIVLSHPGTKYDAKLSFIKGSKKIPIDYLQQRLVRDPMMISLLKEFREKVNKNEYKPDEWGRFIHNRSDTSLERNNPSYSPGITRNVKYPFFKQVVTPLSC